jgi:hypothetical protein
MEFRTQVPIQKQKDNLIDYTSKVLLIGSCFSENIGEKFEYYKFQKTVNPFGILFHPKAIATFFERVVQEQYYTENYLVFHNEQYHCFDVHSSLSNSNKEELLNNLNSILKTVKAQLQNTSHVIITLGTAWVYEHKKQNIAVANCHKIPQKEFHKRILSIEDITLSLQQIQSFLVELNPDVQIIYTVSPVRHLKDGFVENQQSKAHLLTAVHQLVSNSNVAYFPSYEIMMDELRDYRFYKEDMVHPNQIAVDYIWQQFYKTWCHESTEPVMKQVATIQKGLEHKPFNPNSEQHQQFLEDLNDKKKVLLKNFLFMKF